MLTFRPTNSAGLNPIMSTLAGFDEMNLPAISTDHVQTPLSVSSRFSAGGVEVMPRWGIERLIRRRMASAASRKFTVAVAVQPLPLREKVMGCCRTWGWIAEVSGRAVWMTLPVA
jgi:hypothetical protein